MGRKSDLEIFGDLLDILPVGTEITKERNKPTSKGYFWRIRCKRRKEIIEVGSLGLIGAVRKIVVLFKEQKERADEGE